MEYYNPITELEWLYGEWEGVLANQEDEFKTSLTIRPIGSEIIEFNQLLLKNKILIQFEKNTFFYDKTNEIIKLFSFNHEGYIEIANITINAKKKLTEIHSIFSSGFNLPPNMKITKEWIFTKNPKQLNYKVKMGKDENIIIAAELRFSKS